MQRLITRENKFQKAIMKKGHWLCILAFLNILLMVGSGVMLREFPQKNQERVRYVILRYDDYRLYKDYDYRVYNDYLERTSHEEEFIDFVLANNTKISIVPVPFAVSNGEIQKSEVLPSRVELLTEGLRENLVEICLHGYEHRNNSVEWSPSEFSGVPVEIQKEWINKGKRRLEALTRARVKVFVPPFNGWDENTLMALADNGFSILSAEAGAYPTNNRIRYFPYTVGPKELEYLLANNCIGEDRLIVVNIHPHDLSEEKNRIGFSNLRNVLGEIKDPSRKMEVLFFEEAVAKGIVFTQEELRRLSRMFDQVRFWKNLPLSSYLIRTTCLAANRPYYSNVALHFLKAVMGVNLFMIGFLASGVAGGKIKSKALLCGLIAFLGLLVFVILLRSFEYLNYGEIVAGKRYSTIFLVFGILTGFILKILVSNKSNIQESEGSSNNVNRQIDLN